MFYAPNFIAYLVSLWSGEVRKRRNFRGHTKLPHKYPLPIPSEYLSQTWLLLSCWFKHNLKWMVLIASVFILLIGIWADFGIPRPFEQTIMISDQKSIACVVCSLVCRIYYGHILCWIWVHDFLCVSETTKKLALNTNIHNFARTGI